MHKQKRGRIIKVWKKGQNVINEWKQQISNKRYSTGNYKIIFNSKHLSSGIYYLKLQNNSNSITRKLVIK